MNTENQTEGQPQVGSTAVLGRPPQIDAVRNNVVWEQTEQCMPAPEELALMAGSVPNAPRYLCASDYGESAEALRRKGYTWKEVQGWLAKHGADFSIQALISGWRTWGRNHSA